MSSQGIEVLIRMIANNRLGHFDLEIFCDDIRDISSDPLLRRRIALEILTLSHDFEGLNLIALTQISSSNREEIRQRIHGMASAYLAGEYFEDLPADSELVGHPEIYNPYSGEYDFEAESFEESAIEFDGILVNQPKPSFATFCQVCGEMSTSYLMLDEHLLSQHSELFTERYTCIHCPGLWLTKHFH